MPEPKNDLDLDRALRKARIVPTDSFKEDMRARLQAKLRQSENPAFSSNGWRRPSQVLDSRSYEEENKAMSNPRLIPAFAVGIVLVLILALGSAILLPSVSGNGQAPTASAVPSVTPGAMGTAVPTLKGDPIPDYLLNVTYRLIPTDELQRLYGVRLYSAGDPICEELGLKGNCFTMKQNGMHPSFPILRGPAVMIDNQVAIQFQDAPMERAEQGKIAYFDVQDGGNTLFGAHCDAFHKDACWVANSTWVVQPLPTPVPGQSLVMTLPEIIGVWHIEGTDTYVQINPDGTAITSLTATKTDKGVRVDKENGESDYLLTARISLEDSQIRWADTGGTLYTSKKRMDVYLGVVGLYDLRFAENISGKQLLWSLVMDKAVIGRTAELTAGPWIYEGPIAP